MQIFQSFTPEVIELLKSGAVGVIPTDTIYGVAARLSNQAAIERIYTIKNRDLNKRIGTTLISDPNQIEQYVSAHDLLAAQVYWPGPVSVEFKVGPVLAYAHRGFYTLAFRLPDSKLLQNVIQQTGPLATTSANFAGELPAVTMQDALGTFRENVDFYVDGGDLSGRKPSTIIRFNEQGEVETVRGDSK